MKIPASLLLLLLISCAGQAPRRDAPVWSNEHELGEPLFSFDLVKRIGNNPDTCRLDVIAEIVNDMLMFVRDGDGYSASAELGLSVLNHKNQQVFRQVKYLKCRVDSYKDTNSRREFQVGYFTADLPPGEYAVKLMLFDQESQRRSIRERKAVLTANIPNAAVALSDMILTRSEEYDADANIPLMPTVGGMVTDTSTQLYAFVDVYRADPAERCKLTLSLEPESGQAANLQELVLDTPERLKQLFLPIAHKELAFQKYTITLTASVGADTVRKSTSLMVNYHGLPGVIRNIDQAIRQLRYVATGDEVNRMLGEFPSRKEEILIRFWNDKFPVEGEAVNGKMVEYYTRIQYANENFGNLREGWETDRGQVYVLYGMPTEIERRVAEDQNEYYEIWYYNHLNRSFVFRDEYGFGDYRLTSSLW